jgi:hypothetical protein
MEAFERPYFASESSGSEDRLKAIAAGLVKEGEPYYQLRRTTPSGCSRLTSRPSSKPSRMRPTGAHTPSGSWHWRRRTSWCDTRGAPAKELNPGLDEDDSSHPIITEVYMNGNCGNLALAITAAFAHVKILYSREINHVVAQMDGRLFDIRGDVTELMKDVPDFIVVKPYKLVNMDVVNNYSFGCRGPMV